MIRPQRLAVIGTAALIAVAGLGATAHAETGGHIIAADSPDAIDGHYIVRLTDDTAPRTADALAQRYGGTLDRAYRHALHGFATTMDASDARELAADPAVDAVIADRRVGVTAVQDDPPSPGLDRIDQRELPLDNTYRYPDSAGEGSTVYVIDTGVRTSHHDFGGRAVSGYDFVDDDADADDCNGHGTHLAGTAAGTEYGVAKAASVVAVRVLDCDGAGTTSRVVAGIDWVTQQASESGTPAVADLALGGQADQALDDAVTGSIEAGVAYAVTAGNSGTDACQFSPGRVPEALTVGATDTGTDQIDRSNTGSCVDLYAPGTGIVSDWYTDDDATQTLSGSSSTAHAAGALALYRAEHPDATPGEASAALVDNASPIPGPDGDSVGLLYTGFLVD